MSAHISVFALITLWVSVQDGLCLLVMKPHEVRASDDLPPQRVRNKRCSCSTLIDSECFYFCHLDIIWVNTPRTTVYGLGSHGLSRHPRSADRCTCADPDDHTCSRFCHHRAAASGSRRVLGAPESHRNKALKLREQMITKQCGH